MNMKQKGEKIYEQGYSSKKKSKKDRLKEKWGAVTILGKMMCCKGSCNLEN